MYPPETSLIPVTVALARFVETNGFASMLGNYPYWYLGVPFQYLTGPIVPLLQVFLHKILPGFSLFELTYLLIFLSFIASVVGWAWLVIKIQKVKFKLFSFSIGHLAFIVLLVLPWRYLSTLALSEASATISKNLLPFVLIAFWQYYKKRSRQQAVYAVIALSILLLISTNILAIFGVGITALLLSASFKKSKIRGLTKKIKPSLFLILYSLFLVTLWYTPGYWITVFANPSIGGASGIKVFLRIFDLLKASLPLVLAVIAVYFSTKVKSRLSLFSLTWLFTFLFLTVFRFIGDPDFWQDWTAWLFELEIGVALLASKVIVDIRLKILDKKKKPFNYYVVIAALIIPLIITYYVYGLLQKPKLISNTIPRGVQSLEKLSEIAGDKRVFLSGSTVFWAGSTGSPLNQVRGGIDKGATNPFWDHAAFQLREGSSPELAGAWLESLGVSYVLVHTKASPEVYKDFRNISKWGKVGEIVWEENGDAIVKVDDSTLAWVVDLVGLENVKSPEGGADIIALNKYLGTKKRSLKLSSSTNEITVSINGLKKGEGIVIAESYSRNWKAPDGFKIEKDPLGNLLVIPKKFSSSTISLEYK